MCGLGRPSLRAHGCDVFCGEDGEQYQIGQAGASLVLDRGSLWESSWFHWGWYPASLCGHFCSIHNNNCKYECSASGFKNPSTPNRTVYMYLGCESSDFNLIWDFLLYTKPHFNRLFLTDALTPLMYLPLFACRVKRPRGGSRRGCRGQWRPTGPRWSTSRDSWRTGMHRARSCRTRWR